MININQCIKDKSLKFSFKGINPSTLLLKLKKNRFIHAYMHTENKNKNRPIRVVLDRGGVIKSSWLLKKIFCLIRISYYHYLPII